MSEAVHATADRQPPGTAPSGTVPRSQALRLKLELAQELAGRRPAEPSLAAYVDYLQRMYDIVRASVPLMRLARARCPRDAAGRALRAYFDMHIVEESGHDELALQDLEELGIPRTAMASRLPNRAVAAMVGAQYYWIEHVSPIALLGYIAFLENDPPTAGQIAAIRRVLPPGIDATRALRVHCDADPLHKRELDQLIDSLDLDEDQALLIGANALHTAFLAAQTRHEARFPQ
jgi:hypothetical protein